VLAGLIWLMRRAGRAAGRAAAWGRPKPLWQHALVLIVPVTVAVLAPPLWAALGPVETNWPVAILTGLAALAALLRIGLRPGGRARSAAP